MFRWLGMPIRAVIALICTIPAFAAALVLFPGVLDIFIRVLWVNWVWKFEDDDF